jgi:hypothetical protein
VAPAGLLGGVVQLWSHTVFALVAMAIGITLLAIGPLMLWRALELGTRVAGAVELLAIECGFIAMPALRLFRVAALLAPIVGFPAAVGLVITAVDRLVSLAVLSVLAAIVTFATRRQRREQVLVGAESE